MPEAARILLVEDTPELREDLALEMRDAGYTVIEACDGGSAISAFVASSPDLLICDIQLPDIDGISVLTEIRSRAGGDVPAIIVSAFSDAALRAKAGHLQVEHFLVKPIDYDDLLHAIAQLTAR